MRLLADENFPGAAVTLLIKAGHDVTWIRTTAPGISDDQALERAIRERRILLTFDKDFGALARDRGLPDFSGVILFRMPMRPAHNIGERLLARIASRADWTGHFSVVEPGRVRMRTLKAT